MKIANPYNINIKFKKKKFFPQMSPIWHLVDKTLTNLTLKVLEIFIPEELIIFLQKIWP